MKAFACTLPAALGWMLAYFAVIAGCTAIHIVLWRPLFPRADLRAGAGTAVPEDRLGFLVHFGAFQL